MTISEIKKPNVYDFRSFTDFFSAYIDYFQHSEKNFSFEWLARKIDIKSRSYLHNLKTGRRPPTQKFLAKFSELIDLTDLEHEFSVVLIQMETSKDLSEKAYFTEKLLRMLPLEETTELSQDEMGYYGAWHNVIILEMVDLDDFDGTPEWIAGRLGNHISIGEAQESLLLLEKEGLLQKNSSGIYEKVTNHTRTPNQEPIESIRTFHKKMMQLATSAIDKQPIDRRYFQGYTIAIDRNNLPEAVHILNECFDKLSVQLGSGERNEVYHLGIQFFAATESVE